MRNLLCFVLCVMYCCAYAQDTTDAFNRAVSSFQKGEHKKAIALFSEAIDEDPKRVNAYFNRAQCYSILGDHAKAVADMSNAIEIVPNDKELYKERGTQYIALTWYPKAEGDFTKALELDSTYIDAIVERSYAYQMQERPKEALADMNWALALDSTLNIYFNRALLKKEMGDLQGALVDYDTMLARTPYDLSGLYNRAILKSELDSLEGAIEDYYVALRVDSTYSNAWFNLMSLLIDVEEYQEAVAAASKVISLEPKAHDAYYERGNAYYLMKEDSKACEDWKRAQELGSTLANEVLEKYCDK